MNQHQKKDEVILMSHGGGGTRTKSIINDIILKNLGNAILAKLDDAACITVPESELALTTDSYVVQPIFFPGGDIGKLAVCGTINDLAMQGAEPRYLCLGLILEEGLPVSDLEKIIQSMGRVLSATGVSIVTGDTKVVERGQNNGLLINTSGMGVRCPGVDVHVSNACPGDVIIITGSIGDHGIAVISCREGLKFESELVSDVAPLWDLTHRLLKVIPNVHCLRDPTRGGLAAARCDIARTSAAGIRINETSLPVKREVIGACRMLGLNPLNVANEGKAVVVCQQEDAEKALDALRSHPYGRDACVIGVVTPAPAGMVLLETEMGGERIVEIPSGEDLPRIC